MESIRFSSFPIQLKGVGVFPNKKNVRVIWVGCESRNKELEALAEKINAVLAKYGKKEEGTSRFIGHLTIARVKKKVELKDVLQKHKNDDFGSFACKSFELRQSVLQRSGPVYTTIAKFQNPS